MHEFVTIPTYLISELPPDKFRALADFLSMADENGEIPISIRELMKRWGWSNTKVTGFIKIITEKGIGKTEKRQKKDSKKDAVFLVNTGFLDNGKDTKKDRKKTEKRQELITEKDSEEQENREEQKNKKEQMYYPNDEKLNQAFSDFVRMRKDIKKPMTERAISIAINRLKELSGNDNDLALQIIEQSILCNWQSFYELKNNSNYQNGRKQERSSKDEKFQRLMEQIRRDEENANRGF